MKSFAEDIHLEKRLLAVWVRRRDMVMFMVSLHGRRALLVKLIDEAEIAAAAAAAAILAAEAGAKRRMLIRQQQWQRQCRQDEQ